MSNSGITGLLVLMLAARPLPAGERTERFDRDPGWDGHNNRAATPPPRAVRQDFGFSAGTSHAGGRPGEAGGFVTPAAEPAFYARKIPRKSFADRLTASGTLACTGRRFHVLLGFFNAGTLNEWRTPNTVALRFAGRGDKFYAYVEYATARWRAGGDSPQGFPVERDPRSGRNRPRGFPSGGAAYRWSLTYDPDGNGGKGVVTATLGGQTAVCHLADGHKQDGAAFDHFGILTVMKSADDGGEVWIDDVTVNGEAEDFSKDPGWEGFHHRRSYETADVRPRFDFGYSPTRHAGGRGAGELGGLVFRGDCRYPPRMAYYGDRLEELSLAKPLRAAGRVCLRRGVSDSTVLLGFFHSRDSMHANPAQDEGLPKSFLGVMVEGPSREGFYFAPAYRLAGGAHVHAASPGAPHILPDGAAHDWSLEYDPAAAGGKGRVTVRLDGHEVRLDLKESDRTGTRFDRFGLVTTWVDGNGQRIYFDDLTYTWKQDSR